MVCSALRRLRYAGSTRRLHLVSRRAAAASAAPASASAVGVSHRHLSSFKREYATRGDERHLDRVKETNPQDVEDSIIFDGEKYTPGKPQGSLPTMVYVYPTCPHCNKVLAFLDIVGHEHSTMVVNPITKAEIKWSETYKKVPIASVAESTLNGSDNIIMALFDKWTTHTNKIAKGASREDYDSWNKRVDEEIARPLFRATSTTWSDALKYTSYVREMSAYPMYIRFVHHMLGTFFTRVGSRKVAKRYGIVDPDGELLVAVQRYLDDFGVKQQQQQQQQMFCGGEVPGLADVVLYGTLRSVQDFDAVKKLLAADERVKSWYRSMQAAAGHEQE